MSDKNNACVQPARGPIGAAESTPSPVDGSVEEVLQMLARVGKPAPDFEATAYHNGGFTTDKLSDHIGEWVLLCFYPGDFTFV